MTTIKKLLTEGMEFINSLINSLPSHRMVNREHLPPQIQPLVPAAPAQAPRAAPAPRPAAPPQAAPAAPGAQAAPPAGGDGDPGVGSKKDRFQAMYRALNGTGMTRNAFRELAMQRLDMTVAGSGTYMATAANVIGPWRLG